MNFKLFKITPKELNRKIIYQKRYTIYKTVPDLLYNLVYYQSMITVLVS